MLRIYKRFCQFFLKIHFLILIFIDIAFGRFPIDLLPYLIDFQKVTKIIKYKGRFIIHSYIPPYPSESFYRFIDEWTNPDRKKGHLYALDLAITNRCIYSCSHCYNAFRDTTDLNTKTWLQVIKDAESLGAIIFKFSGGEPLLRNDLEVLVDSVSHNNISFILTTGYSLTSERVRALKNAGLFGMAISLDSHCPEIHNRRRGHPKAFQWAIEAIEKTLAEGLYVYLMSVPTPEMRQFDYFMQYVEFVGRLKVPEIYIIEPFPIGRVLWGEPDVIEDDKGFEILLDYQQIIAKRYDLPNVFSFNLLESQRFFGCGGGDHHLYIDGTGEVCPCNVIPLSFGNVQKEQLATIVNCMREKWGCANASCRIRRDKKLYSQRFSGKLPFLATDFPEILSTEKTCQLHPQFYKIIEKIRRRRREGMKQ